MVDRQDEDARPRNRRLPREVRERQILDAAVEVFAARGFHAASMDEIADVAGISKPMLYAYLGAKDELFIACLRREATRLTEAIGAAAEAGLSPDEQLWRGLRVFFEYVHRNQDSWTVLHRQISQQGEHFVAELAAWRERATSLIAALLSRATGESSQPGQTEPFAAALVGAAEAMVEWWFQHPEHTADGMAMRLMNMSWMGFGSLVEGRTWSPGE